MVDDNDKYKRKAKMTNKSNTANTLDESETKVRTDSEKALEKWKSGLIFDTDVDMFFDSKSGLHVDLQNNLFYDFKQEKYVCYHFSPKYQQYFELDAGQVSKFKKRSSEAS